MSGTARSSQPTDPSPKREIKNLISTSKENEHVRQNQRIDRDESIPDA